MPRVEYDRRRYSLKWCDRRFGVRESGLLARGARDLLPGFGKVATARTRVAASTARPVLRRAHDESLPSEQEKAVAAKRAVIGLKEPLESPLHGTSGAYAPKIDGSAMRAQRVEKSPTVARIMSLCPLSPHRLGQDRRDLGTAQSRVRGGRYVCWPQRGLLRAPPPVVPVSSGRAPTV
jgi:hypothetical protein